jgi:hypothetical protein
MARLAALPAPPTAWALTAGSAILDAVYAGDYDAFRAATRRDRVCAELSRHLSSPFRPVSAAALRLAIHAAALARIHGVEVVTGLSRTKLQIVAAAPAAIQATLLAQCAGLSARALARAAERVHPAGAGRPGRRRLPPHLRAAGNLARAIPPLQEALRQVSAKERRSASAAELLRLATRLVELAGSIRARLLSVPPAAPAWSRK